MSAFKPRDLGAALDAGGKVVNGYELSWGMMTGEVAAGGWCGYSALGVGYALRREVAEVVCAASIAEGGVE